MTAALLAIHPALKVLSQKESLLIILNCGSTSFEKVDIERTVSLI